MWALNQTPRLPAWPQSYLLGRKTQGLFSVTARDAGMGGRGCVLALWTSAGTPRGFAVKGHPSFYCYLFYIDAVIT